RRSKTPEVRESEDCCRKEHAPSPTPGSPRETFLFVRSSGREPREVLCRPDPAPGYASTAPGNGRTRGGSVISRRDYFWPGRKAGLTPVPCGSGLLPR